MKLYDRVKQILENHPITRSSDKHLIWTVWKERGLTHRENIPFNAEKLIENINLESFLRAPAPESITRARRKVQENHPNLAATPQVEAARAHKAEQKGMFVYRQEDL